MADLSRRSFLKQSAIAAGGWVLLPALARAEAGVDPHRFVLMADIHVCADRNARERDCNPDETMEQAVKDILELAPRPSGVLVAGDCVYLHGTKPDYEMLEILVRPLRTAGIPLFLAMGNHDNRENFQAVFPDAAILSGGAVENRKCAVVETPQADWYLLDSLEKTDYTPGRFGKEQLAWLAERLDAKPAKPALLLAHHYPKNRADDGGLEDTNDFFEHIRPRRQVKAYFYGHSHVWSIKDGEEGLHLINIPANAWIFNESQLRGFVEARLSETSCVLTLHCLDRNDPRHGKEFPLDWRLNEG